MFFVLVLGSHSIEKYYKSQVNKIRLLFLYYICNIIKEFIFHNQMLSKIVAIYMLLINVFTFIIRWLDKRKSVKHKRRISEKHLLIFSALWWFIWAIIWMWVRHHKTIKSDFLRKFWLIVFGWIVVLWLGYYFSYLY